MSGGWRRRSRMPHCMCGGRGGALAGEHVAACSPWWCDWGGARGRPALLEEVRAAMGGGGGWMGSAGGLDSNGYAKAADAHALTASPPRPHQVPFWNSDGQDRRLAAPPNTRARIGPPRHSFNTFCPAPIVAMPLVPQVLWAQRADRLLLTIDLQNCKDPKIRWAPWAVRGPPRPAAQPPPPPPLPSGRCYSGPPPHAPPCCT